MMHKTEVLKPRQAMRRSLRLRLVLWYGSLIAVALGFFGLLFLFLTTDAITTSVNSALQTEARVAMVDVLDDVHGTPPYWAAQLTMRVVDTYRDPGVVVEVLDTQGQMLYPSNGGPRIPISNDTIRSMLAGQASVTYETAIDGQHVRVQALPVRAPTEGVSRNTNGVPLGNGPVIGVLLVAKSLADVDATMLLLRALLLLSGVITLVGTLIASWLIATRVLHPLSDLSATARAIAASTVRGTRFGNLSRRVPQPRGRDELAQVMETFNEMLASLESATETQRRFVADASHELRAPLTTIQGNLAFLQHHLEELPPSERQIMLTDAHEETIRLAELVDELLVLARADANNDTSIELQRMEPVPEERSHSIKTIELDRIVLQLVRQLRKRLSAEGSQLQLEVRHIEPLRVRGDDESIRRILLILLDNAIKYTPIQGNGSTNRVTVSLERCDAQAMLQVHDTGIGIDPEDLPHIFERFYRADRARSRYGTGLGLSIAQTLAEQLGGRITAESKPDMGSTFSVYLPL
ncbi:MAG TPA: HAMP domain-containing sensor histidine kinase, partial [Ktedonobacteraceae bacterium]|nr:HAMP domain-containing sensor histidine kinase [Ktedonobacteraceae bacterium]